MRLGSVRFGFSGGDCPESGWPAVRVLTASRMGSSWFLPWSRST